MNSCLQFISSALPRLNIHYAQLAFVLATLFSQATFSQSPAIELKADQSYYSFAGKFAYLEDTTGALTLSDILLQSTQDSFQLITRNNISLGYIRPAIWLKFKLENTALTGQNWLSLIR